MKYFVWLTILALVGFLAVIPVAKFLITRNQVERELETAMIEYQTLPKEKFKDRLERIARENGLKSSGLKISIDDAGGSTASATISYTSSFKIFFVPVSRVVTVTKSTTKLGM